MLTSGSQREIRDNVLVHNFEQTQAYVTALTGHPDSTLDFRCIHDTDKGVPGKALRGTLNEHYQTLLHYNQSGYGIFCCINAMDGHGRNLANVDHIRTHIVDLDNPLSAQASYQQAVASQLKPHFGVQTSPGKYHLYWLVEPYTGNDFYSTQQRKLRQIYDGDRSVIDASRVLRVPGFYHLKDPANPFLVTCWEIEPKARFTFTQIEQALAHINVFDNTGGRFELGEETLAAPSFDWLKFALSKVHPQDLSYEEWMSLTAAYKQSGWSLVDEQTLLNHWLEWCSLYGDENDLDVNMKLWNSIRDTEIGWASLKRRTTIEAWMRFGHKDVPPPETTQVMPQKTEPTQQLATGGVPPMPESMQPRPEDFGEILSKEESAIWFKDCFFIEREGKIFSKTARYMNSVQFNGKYGGKQFITTSTGKTTNKPWEAALYSTTWKIPQVDHVRFVPTAEPYAIVEDDLGRKGLNTYVPAKIKSQPGDITPFLIHIQNLIPDPNDQKILLDYLAHNIKYPGEKIPWAPLIQGIEGLGKSVFYEVLEHALGSMYLYRPKAPELANSGSKFNGWMRSKLMIVVDEIKVDERRELIEILKPMISEARIEIQSKGVDQEMEDNCANWLFFSNFKDAIPIHRNGRRYAIFYSPIQTERDLIAAGMQEDGPYFEHLWDWLKNQNGFEYITDWFLKYPIERGKIPYRAPKTTSYEEAIKLSRSPMEVEIEEAINNGMPGFRGGYISSIAVKKRCKEAGIRTPSFTAIKTCLEGMGYIELGKSYRAYAQDDVDKKPLLFGEVSTLDPNAYGLAQGYE